LSLFNKYLLLVTFETDDNYSIRFKISNNSSTIRFGSKKKTLFSQHCCIVISASLHSYCLHQGGHVIPGAFIYPSKDLFVRKITQKVTRGLG